MKFVEILWFFKFKLSFSKEKIGELVKMIGIWVFYQGASILFDGKFDGKFDEKFDENLLFRKNKKHVYNFPSNFSGNYIVKRANFLLWLENF